MSIGAMGSHPTFFAYVREIEPVRVRNGLKRFTADATSCAMNFYPDTK